MIEVKLESKQTEIVTERIYNQAVLLVSLLDHIRHIKCEEMVGTHNKKGTTSFTVNV